jgi:hypothetical protein
MELVGVIVWCSFWAVCTIAWAVDFLARAIKSKTGRAPG